MTVGHFREMTKDLPDNFRVKLAIDPSVLREGVDDITVSLERTDTDVKRRGGTVRKEVRVYVVIGPEGTSDGDSPGDSEDAQV